LPEATVVWLRKEQFVGVDSSKHSVVLSTQNQDNSVGMKPSELLLISLASCTAVDIVRILAKQRKSLEHLEVQINGEQQQDPPWPYETIHMHFKLRGRDLTTRAVERAIELSETKYCSVAATLRAQVKITKSFEITKGET
jgi:putative redox protein